MKRPMLPVALVFSAGILLADQVEVSLVPLFAAALALTLLALFRTEARAITLAGAVFFAGWAHFAWRAAVLSPHDLRELVREGPALVNVRGVIAGVPSLRVTERDEEEVWRTLVPVETVEIQMRAGQWERACGVVQTRTKGICLTNLFAGQPVVVTGVVEPPPLPKAPGLFDYRTYLRRQGVHYQLNVESEKDWRVIGITNPAPWTEQFRGWAQRTMARGLPGVDEPLKLQWAMVLGWKTALTQEVSLPFMRSGTAHVFAISGLHIALIAGILLALFRVINLPRGICGAVVIPLIWFYTAATEWQASAIRSTVMMTVIIGGWSLRRPGDLINSLAGAAFALLAWDPQQLFQAGFQLSFGAVMSIALFLPLLERVRRRLLQADPLLPEELRPGWQKYVLRGGHHVTQALATSLAACLGTVPLIAHWFHLFTPGSLLANVVVVPLSGLALMSGLGSVLCGDRLPWVTELFNHSGWFFMAAMVQTSEWFASVPGAYCHVAAPGMAGLLLYYSVLFALLGGWLAGRWRWWAGGGITVLALIWGGCWLVDRGTSRVTILPLRRACGLWLEAPGRNGGWLLNCGDPAAVDLITAPFLRGRGVDVLPQLMVTHGDMRHAGGSTNLLESFRLREVLVGAYAFRSLAYRQFLRGWTNGQGRLTTLRAGDRAGPWTVLHPRAEDRLPYVEDHVLVARCELEGVRLLFCSDLGVGGQGTLIHRDADLRADIVIASIPKAGEPLHDGFLRRVKPKLVILSEGEFPASRRLVPRLKLRLARDGVPVLYLGDTQAVTVELSQGRWSARAMEQAGVIDGSGRDGSGAANGGGIRSK